MINLRFIIFIVSHSIGQQKVYIFLEVRCTLKVARNNIQTKKKVSNKKKLVLQLINNRGRNLNVIVVILRDILKLKYNMKLLPFIFDICKISSFCVNVGSIFINFLIIKRKRIFNMTASVEQVRYLRDQLLPLGILTTC